MRRNVSLLRSPACAPHLVIAALAIFLTAAPVYADSVCQISKLLASDGAASDHFGDFIAISGPIDIVDLLALLSAWGMSDPAYDIAPDPPDGTVDIQDLLGVLAAWGSCSQGRHQSAEASRCEHTPRAATVRGRQTQEVQK